MQPRPRRLRWDTGAACRVASWRRPAALRSGYHRCSQTASEGAPKMADGCSVHRGEEGIKKPILLFTPCPQSHAGEKRQWAIAGENTGAGFSLRSGEAPTMPLVSTEHTSISHATTKAVALMQSCSLCALAVVVPLRAKANIHNPRIVSSPAITNKQRAPTATPAEARKRSQTGPGGQMDLFVLRSSAAE